MKLKSIKKCRKGAAMEMALVMLLVVFSFSIVLLTVSLLLSEKRGEIEKSLKEEIIAEQIGKSFCDNVGGDGSWISAYPDYEILEEDLNLTVKDEDGKLLLTVVLTMEDGKYTVEKWSKS
ncbi:MAG: hypothetical protein J6K88_01705 [Oscillospiraceae bacterium]|nr:hypothetical protein [Oscillospiraceae bacterium]